MPLKTLSIVIFVCLHHRWRFSARARQSMLFIRIRSAQSQAALRARHLDFKVTGEDVSRNIPALHARGALAPRACDHLTVTRKIVIVSKVTGEAPSIACNKRRAPRHTACPHTLERGRVQRDIPPSPAWSRCGCCVICEFLSRKEKKRGGKALTKRTGNWYRITIRRRPHRMWSSDRGKTTSLRDPAFRVCSGHRRSGEPKGGDVGSHSRRTGETAMTALSPSSMHGVVPGGSGLPRQARSLCPVQRRWARLECG